MEFNQDSDRPLTKTEQRIWTAVGFILGAGAVGYGLYLLEAFNG